MHFATLKFKKDVNGTFRLYYKLFIGYIRLVRLVKGMYIKIKRGKGRPKKRWGCNIKCDMM